MNRKFATQRDKPSAAPKRLSWLVVFSLLAGSLAIYNITYATIVHSHPLLLLFLWIAGSMTVGFALTRMFPVYISPLFQSVGCVATFTIAVVAGTMAHGGAVPSLGGSVNPTALSGHFDAAVGSVQSFGEDLHTKSTKLISNVYGFVRATLVEQNAQS